MAALTTWAVVGGAVLSGAGTIKGIVDSRKADKRQAAALKAQKDQATEAAALDTTRDDTGADIQLGREGATTAATAGAAGQGGATSRVGAVGSRVGGIKPLKARASKRVGL